ncbi:MULTISPECIES: hypothetical protein [unclassified Marinobacter]|nr:hypothetical protein [Marinobacter sp. LQ44]
MNKAPDLQDPVLMALQNELGLRHTQIQANPDAWFTGDAVCELSSDGQWLVNFSRSEADMDALHTFRERSTGTKTEVQLGVCAAEARFWHNKPKIFRQQDV